MIISLEKNKKRLLSYRKRHMVSNLYASLEAFNVLTVQGEDPEIWEVLRDYTTTLIRELEIEHQTKGIHLL